MVSLHIKHSFVACRSRKRVCHSACITATCVKVLNLQQLKLLFLLKELYVFGIYVCICLCIYAHIPQSICIPLHTFTPSLCFCKFFVKLLVCNFFSVFSTIEVDLLSKPTAPSAQLPYFPRYRLTIANMEEDQFSSLLLHWWLD